MLTLPVDYRPLVIALSSCIQSSAAGLVTAEDGDDPLLLAAALDEASVRTGTPVRSAWVGYGYETLAWLREDDARFQLMPMLHIIGVELQR